MRHMSMEITPKAELSPESRLEKTASPSPSVFDFQDYRVYLSEWLAWKKKLIPQYSGALFAKKAGFNSHTLLGMVIRGDRNLSYSTIQAFLRALGLKKKEATYFERLVLFNQAKKQEERALCFERLKEVSQGISKQVLEKINDHVSYISHWYVVAVHEMIAMDDFVADPDWIAKKLKHKITRKQAIEAWQILLKLELAEQDPVTGNWRRKHVSIDLAPGSVDFAIQNYHIEFLARAQDAVREEPLDEREMSSYTIAVSEEDLPLLRERVRNFRRQLIQDFPVSKAPRTRVVAINTQALLLTEGQAKAKPQSKEREKDEL